MLSAGRQQPGPRQHDVQQGQRRRHLGKSLRVSPSAEQDKSAQDEPSNMQSLKTGRKTSKHTITVSEFRRVLDEEIIASAIERCQEKHKEKANPRCRSSSNGIQFDSVMSTDCAPKAHKSHDAPRSPHEPKHSSCTSEQKLRNRPWCPKVITFHGMSKWLNVTTKRSSACRVHTSEVSCGPPFQQLPVCLACS